MTNYQRGRALEYRVRERLERLGYWVVRSASSKGCADLVAVKAEGLPEYRSHWLLLVQCKLSVGAVGVVEWNRLYETGQKVNGVAVIAQAGGRGKPPRFTMITGLKNGRGGKQPMVEFTP